MFYQKILGDLKNFVDPKISDSTRKATQKYWMDLPFTKQLNPPPPPRMQRCFVLEQQMAQIFLSKIILPIDFVLKHKIPVMSFTTGDAMGLEDGHSRGAL